MLQTILDTPTSKESDIHEHLFKHPVIFVKERFVLERLVFSKHALGVQYIPDFMYLQDDHSPYPIFNMVEIAPPHARLFTNAKGTQTTLHSDFQREYGQVKKWEPWFHNNRKALADEIRRKYYITSDFHTKLADGAMFQGHLYIGRRTERNSQDQKQVWKTEVLHAKANRIDLHSYDYLIESEQSYASLQMLDTQIIKCVGFGFP